MLIKCMFFGMLLANLVSCLADPNICCVWARTLKRFQMLKYGVRAKYVTCFSYNFT